MTDYKDALNPDLAKKFEAAIKYQQAKSNWHRIMRERAERSKAWQEISKPKTEYITIPEMPDPDFSLEEIGFAEEVIGSAEPK